MYPDPHKKDSEIFPAAIAQFKLSNILTQKEKLDIYVFVFVMNRFFSVVFNKKSCEILYFLFPCGYMPIFRADVFNELYNVGLGHLLDGNEGRRHTS